MTRGHNPSKSIRKKHMYKKITISTKEIYFACKLNTSSMIPQLAFNHISEALE
jgi:hypothetical protein